MSDWYDRADLLDAFAIVVPSAGMQDMDSLAHLLIDDPPLWLRWLLRTRDVLVTPWGLKTTGALRGPVSEATTDRVGFFKVYSRFADEMILGEDDTHLDFRLSIHRDGADPAVSGTEDRRVIITTAVRCHNPLGRGYLTLIRPFHRQVVKSLLERAASRARASR